MRIGIYTGPVVVSQLGGDARRETLALGETPNIGARVQSLADTDTVLISAATQRLVAGLFVVEERGPQTLKGVASPVELYRVVQASGVRGRLAAAAAGSLTPSGSGSLHRHDSQQFEQIGRQADCGDRALGSGRWRRIG